MERIGATERAQRNFDSSIKYIERRRNGGGGGEKEKKRDATRSRVIVKRCSAIV